MIHRLLAVFGHRLVPRHDPRLGFHVACIRCPYRMPLPDLNRVDAYASTGGTP